MNRIRREAADVAASYLEARIKFIESLSPVTAATQFQFSLNSRECRIGGQADWLDEQSPGATIYPVLVQIELAEPDPRHYPHYQRHVPELPRVRIESWDEELVLVLAHEMRHAEQYLTSLGAQLLWNDHAMEIDAEEFAYRALEAWRDRQYRNNTQRAA